MQIKNITEDTVNILKEWLYLKNMLDWSDPEASRFRTCCNP